MAKSKTETLTQLLRGKAYIGDNGLQDYHAAKAVLAAMRRRDPVNRLSGVREALRQYRVSAWLESGNIVLRHEGKDIMVIV